MAHKGIKWTVRCDKHGSILPPPFKGEGKEVIVPPPKGKHKHLGCPICRKEQRKVVNA